MSASSVSKIIVDDSSPESSSAKLGVNAGNNSDVSQEIADLLSSFSTQKSAVAGKSKEHRPSPRFRVNWKAEIANDGRNTLHGFIRDLSAKGASIYLNNSLLQVKSTLHIHIPPLNLTGKPHVMAVSGNIVYVVYDSNKQLFRAAIIFNRFHRESDLPYLEERLTKYHLKIPEY